MNSQSVEIDDDRVLEHRHRGNNASLSRKFDTATLPFATNMNTAFSKAFIALNLGSLPAAESHHMQGLASILVGYIASLGLVSATFEI